LKHQAHFFHPSFTTFEMGIGHAGPQGLESFHIHFLIRVKEATQIPMEMPMHTPIKNRIIGISFLAGSQNLISACLYPY
jgi:hypothetical protein